MKEEFYRTAQHQINSMIKSFYKADHVCVVNIAGIKTVSLCKVLKILEQQEEFEICQQIKKQLDQRRGIID